MRRRILAAYLAVVLLPLGVLGWLSARVARMEVERAEVRAEELARASLLELCRDVGELLAARRRGLMAALGAASTEEELRREGARLPGVRQTFCYVKGALAYPSVLDELGEEEEAFLRRTAGIWVDGRVGASDGSNERADTGSGFGWYVWRMDDGLHFICWWRESDGAILGAEVDRVPLLAEVVASLPEDAPARGRFRLLDADGGVLHQWGAYTPGASEAPLAREPLSPPLGSWTLEYFAPPGGSPVASLATGAVPWFSGLAVLVAGLAWHVYRESTRELRDAATRVTFVNQVSHELKTPLTNIRMYGELLESGAPDEETARQWAGVVAAESQRLGRLIENVLAFGKRQRRELRLHRRPGVVDEVVGRVIEHFRPSLAARSVALDADLDAKCPCSFDPDALEQILGNLLSNVEKYAAAGGLARISTRRDGSRVRVMVADRGPGVAPELREKVFEPFFRVSSALTDGVTGAGIGLTLARDLARLHGGDLRIVGDGPGACFEVTMEAAEA